MTDPRVITAITIPVDAEAPIIVAPIDGTEAGLAAAVGGGFPERVVLGDSTAVLVCNADGKSRPDLAVNPRATRLVDDFVPGYAKVDQIHGPVVVVGTNPEDGTVTDAPDHAVAAAARY